MNADAKIIKKKRQQMASSQFLICNFSFKVDKYLSNFFSGSFSSSVLTRNPCSHSTTEECDINFAFKIGMEPIF